MKKAIWPIIIVIAILVGALLSTDLKNTVLGSSSGRDLYNYTHISSSDAGTIKIIRSTQSILGSVVIASSTTAGEIIIYDNSSATGISTTTIASSTATKISRIKGATSENTLTYDVMAKDGIVLGIPSTFNGSYTITWK